MTTIKPTSRTDLINQATELAEQVADLKQQPAVEQPQGPAPVSQLEAKALELDHLLSQIRNLSLRPAFDKLLADLPGRALEAIEEIKGPVGAGESAREVVRDRWAAMHGAEPGLREWIGEKAAELRKLEKDPEWQGVKEMHYHGSRYRERLDKARVDEAKQEARKATREANEGKKFWQKRVEVAPVEVEPITDAEFAATIAEAQALVRAKNEEILAQGYPEAMLIQVPFVEGEGVFQLDGHPGYSALSVSSRWSDDTLPDVAVPVLAEARTLRGDIAQANKDLTAVREHIKTQRPDVDGLQKVRDDLLEQARTDPQSLLRSIHQIMMDMSHHASSERTARGTLETRGTESSSTSYNESRRHNLGKPYHEDGRGGRVDKNPLASTTVSGSSSTRTSFTLESEFLIPDASEFEFDVLRNIAVKGRAEALPDGERFLFPGEEGLILDDLLRLVRSVEALEFEYPRTQVVEQLAKWLDNSTVKLAFSRGHFKIFEDQKVEVTFNMSRLRDDITANIGKLSKQADYTNVLPVLKAELESPLRHV